VTFDETPPPSKTSPLVDDDLDEVEATKVKCAVLGHLITSHLSALKYAALSVMAEVGTANNTDHTVAEHIQTGYRLPEVEHCKPQPCAQTLPGTCPNDMTAYTPSSQSPADVSPYYPSYHTSPA
ncbi:hypothetical protein Tco_0983545, partial [Tanacetum coccineum]